jgi:glycosyltransferase involved in cell wall biosynthesis
VLYEAPAKSVAKLFFQNFFYVLKLLVVEFFQTNKKFYFLKNLRKINGMVCHNLYRAYQLKAYLLKRNQQNSDNWYYSFWMDEGAMIYSILKDQKVIPDFVFRVLGYDLYDERREGHYMPFRYLNFKMTRRIYCISRDGFSYLTAKDLFTEKLELSYLSVFDNGVNQMSNPHAFVMVSCSSFLPLKRVHLIIEVLKHVKKELTWIHFGEGGGEKQALIDQIRQLPSNITVELKGHRSNSEILDFYRENQVNLVIHLSETEGGAPVALQEAASFGIPLLGTNAGGIPEIVTPQTGILIPVDFNIIEVAELINTFKDSHRNTAAFRQSVRKFWFENFNAAINYNKLCDSLMKSN